MAYIEEKQFSFFSEIPQEGITDSDVENALKRGSGFDKGKKRIAKYFLSHPQLSERSEFLKLEYGVGGMYPVCKSENGFEFGIDYNASGVKLWGFDNQKEYERKIKWPEVARIIDRLIFELGSY